ncbi:MAG: NTP transferase domain-containing protein [Phycisphaerales bacterium]|nr:NTP transferase domain-containing protein [Phycisphaerales bacterium]
MQNDTTSSRSGQKPLAAIILAAGKGTRMGSDLPKVLHPVADRPMLHWVVDAVRTAGAAPILLVVGHGQELVRAQFEGQEDIIFVEQSPQLGTGHAVHVCADALEGFAGDTFVLAGDGPLVRSDLLAELVRTHRDDDAAATLATATLDDPTGYGRIIRDEKGAFEQIVEQKNATAQQAAVGEVYPSYAVFDVPELMQALAVLPRDEVSGEYYLTVVPRQLADKGLKVSLVGGVPPEDILSINTPEQLQLVDGVLRNRRSSSPTGVL